MAGKSIESRAPISLEDLKERVQTKYASELFDHPEGYGTFEVARLKRHERAAIQTASRLPGGMVDVEVQNRMAAAFGLVSPKVSAEELKEYPDDFIEPIADKVWEISNAYRTHTDENGKGDGKDAPFFRKMSGSSIGSSTEPTSPPTSSKDGTTSD
jgi:hypothetical protein